MFYALWPKNAIQPSYKQKTEGLIGSKNFFTKKIYKFHSTQMLFYGPSRKNSTQARYWQKMLDLAIISCSDPDYISVPKLKVYFFKNK